ncbi:GAP family protein [Heyndrickxia oleronia]|jgi:cytochrome c biogenesis protein CcdA|uniref:GAP family protein n=1 Tax=Heyndrickxia oleronia TaxID=38875 RepID=A0AAW6T2Q3_9BACI|nr:GAP family protein [Heyndrickxia oleronia]MCI1590236.1 GAP family protein [Heyndrickxia oleronia]MCI1614018.1 GAP family protein [Heyndrickxia oleronia]MCI1744330.1 GAP family protein [Heyndrickxia oleronia]MCI1761880.1 GAP family protein [Heyndrickxia oleronia]MDH5163662.1 GAP family protein [Heyndrickxia oleronia]
MSIELLFMVGGLALLDMMSPAALGVTVYLLLNEKERLSSRLMIYLFTVAGFYFLVGVFLMLGLDVVMTAFSSIFQNRIVSWVMLIIGGILFIASFYYPKSKKTDLPRPKSNSNAAMVALGFTTSLIEVGTAFPYFAAIGLMTTSNLAAFQWLPILAGYNFIMVLPLLIVFTLYLLLGRVMQRPLEMLRIKLSKHSGSAISWIMCVVGLILIFNSLDYL